MKKRHGAFAISAILFMVLAGFVSTAAGWKVHLSSDIDYAAQVELRDILKPLGTEQTLTQTLPPHGTYTFDTGAKCPVWVRGTIDAEGYSSITDRCVGAEDTNVNACKPACFDTTYKLIRKEVKPGYKSYLWERQY